ncbi:MAG: hypothetical protein RL263_95 [Bacteroidota bacterium]|jgi:hypothetical protein
MQFCAHKITAVFPKVSLLVGILLWFSSCSKNLPVNDEKLVEILADAMRLEASQQVAYNYLTMPDSAWDKGYSFILKKHQVSAADFEKTMNYYQKNAQEFSDLMGKVVDVLNKEELKDYRR